MEAKIRMRDCVRRIKAEPMGQRVIKVSKLEKTEVRKKYKRQIEMEWERVKENRVTSIEEEWKILKTNVLKCAAVVCGNKRLGKKRERSAWWDEEIKDLVKEKRRLFEATLTDRNERNVTMYKRVKREVSRMVREKKAVLDEADGEKMSKHFRENKKLF